MFIFRKSPELYWCGWVYGCTWGTPSKMILMFCKFTSSHRCFVDDCIMFHRDRRHVLNIGKLGIIQEIDLATLTIDVISPQNVSSWKWSLEIESNTPPTKADFTWRSHRNIFRQILNVFREWDSDTSLGSQFQCSIIRKLKKFVLTFRWNFLCSSQYPLVLVLPCPSISKSSYSTLVFLRMDWFVMAVTLTF